MARGVGCRARERPGAFIRHSDRPSRRLRSSRIASERDLLVGGLLGDLGGGFRHRLGFDGRLGVADRLGDDRVVDGFLRRPRRPRLLRPPGPPRSPSSTAASTTGISSAGCPRRRPLRRPRPPASSAAALPPLRPRLVCGGLLDRSQGPRPPAGAGSSTRAASAWATAARMSSGIWIVDTISGAGSRRASGSALISGSRGGASVT